MAEETLAPGLGSPPLTDLVAAVLIDVARAQHLSNVYSAKLGEIYKADPLLRPFPVPNGYVSGVEISLKFGIDGLGADGRRPEALLAQAYAAFDAFVERITPRVTAVLAKTLIEEADAFGDDGAEWLARGLGDERLVHLLTAAVQERVHSTVPDAVTESGELRWDVAEPAIASALRTVIVDHPDYGRLNERARRRVYDEITALTNATGRVDALRARLVPAVTAEPEVRVATRRDVLVSIGAEILGSLQLSTSVRDFLVEAAPVEGSASDGLPSPITYRLVRASH